MTSISFAWCFALCYNVKVLVAGEDSGEDRLGVVQYAHAQPAAVTEKTELQFADLNSCCCEHSGKRPNLGRGD